MTSVDDALTTLREKGWSVAVHNDYRLSGRAYTFWLFTNQNGRWIKGEGRSDEEALNEVLLRLPVHDASLAEVLARAHDPVAWRWIDQTRISKPDHIALPLTVASQLRNMERVLAALPTLDQDRLAAIFRADDQGLPNTGPIPPRIPNNDMLQAGCTVLARFYPPKANGGSPVGQYAVWVEMYDAYLGRR